MSQAGKNESDVIVHSEPKPKQLTEQDIKDKDNLNEVLSGNMPDGAVDITHLVSDSIRSKNKDATGDIFNKVIYDRKDGGTLYVNPNYNNPYSDDFTEDSIADSNSSLANKLRNEILPAVTEVAMEEQGIAITHSSGDNIKVHDDWGIYGKHETIINNSEKVKKFADRITYGVVNELGDFPIMHDSGKDKIDNIVDNDDNKSNRSLEYLTDNVIQEHVENFLEMPPANKSNKTYMKKNIMPEDNLVAIKINHITSEMYRVHTQAVFIAVLNKLYNMASRNQITMVDFSRVVALLEDVFELKPVKVQRKDISKTRCSKTVTEIYNKIITTQTVRKNVTDKFIINLVSDDMCKMVERYVDEFNELNIIRKTSYDEMPSMDIVAIGTQDELVGKFSKQIGTDIILCQAESRVPLMRFSGKDIQKPAAFVNLWSQLPNHIDTYKVIQYARIHIDSFIARNTLVSNIAQTMSSAVRNKGILSASAAEIVGLSKSLKDIAKIRLSAKEYDEFEWSKLTKDIKEEHKSVLLRLIEMCSAAIGKKHIHASEFRFVYSLFGGDPEHIGFFDVHRGLEMNEKVKIYDTKTFITDQVIKWMDKINKYNDRQKYQIFTGTSGHMIVRAMLERSYMWNFINDHEGSIMGMFLEFIRKYYGNNNPESNNILKNFIRYIDEKEKTSEPWFYKKLRDFKERYDTEIEKDRVKIFNQEEFDKDYQLSQSFIYSVIAQLQIGHLCMDPNYPSILGPGQIAERHVEIAIKSFLNATHQEKNVKWWNTNTPLAAEETLIRGVMAPIYKHFFGQMYFAFANHADKRISEHKEMMKRHDKMTEEEKEEMNKLHEQITYDSIHRTVLNSMQACMLSYMNMFHQNTSENILEDNHIIATCRELIASSVILKDHKSLCFDVLDIIVSHIRTQIESVGIKLGEEQQERDTKSKTPGYDIKQEKFIESKDIYNIMATNEYTNKIHNKIIDMINYYYDTNIMKNSEHVEHLEKIEYSNKLKEEDEEEIKVPEEKEIKEEDSTKESKNIYANPVRHIPKNDAIEEQLYKIEQGYEMINYKLRPEDEPSEKIIDKLVGEYSSKEEFFSDDNLIKRCIAEINEAHKVICNITGIGDLKGEGNHPVLTYVSKGFTKDKSEEESNDKSEEESESDLIEKSIINAVNNYKNNSAPTIDTSIEDIDCINNTTNDESYAKTSAMINELFRCTNATSKDILKTNNPPENKSKPNELNSELMTEPLDTFDGSSSKTTIDQKIHYEPPPAGFNNTSCTKSEPQAEDDDSDFEIYVSDEE